MRNKGSKPSHALRNISKAPSEEQKIFSWNHKDLPSLEIGECCVYLGVGGQLNKKHVRNKMKIFICYRSIDKSEGEQLIRDLLNDSDNTIAVLTETEHSENWKDNVETKIKESDFVGFFVGTDTFESEQIKWEYSKAKSLNKQIFGIKLAKTSEQSILFCQGFQVFDTPKQSIAYLEKVLNNDRFLKIEQYKIMVSSTEKVTAQRMKVNNLFFTVTSTILSITFILGKTYHFNVLSIIGMFLLTSLTLLSSFYWQNLIKAYGKLNTGKFQVINRIEKELRTNMFDEEWQILKNEIGYKSNTKTETQIIVGFRIFIIALLVGEVAFAIIQICNKYH